VGVGQMRVRVWIERLGNSSLTFGLRCLAMDEDLDFARGSRVIVKVHPETRAPERWSDEVRQRLDAYRADALPV
jgi:acyl-CoA thioester hydrolase